MSLGWVVAGAITYLTVIGIPWGRSCFVIAGFTAGNIVWPLLAGWWLALGHLVAGLITCLTVIGIPFGFNTPSSRGYR